jgi:hypothetical protein
VPVNCAAVPEGRQGQVTMYTINQRAPMIIIFVINQQKRKNRTVKEYLINQKEGIKRRNKGKTDIYETFHPSTAEYLFKYWNVY